MCYKFGGEYVFGLGNLAFRCQNNCISGEMRKEIMRCSYTPMFFGTLLVLVVSCNTVSHYVV